MSGIALTPASVLAVAAGRCGYADAEGRVSGARLAAALRARGAHITEGAVRYWLRGESVPGAVTLAALRDVLGLTADEVALIATWRRPPSEPEVPAC